ncbi:hypothetical protein E2C01_098879 [Portunus trituberculatus]|uniref:Uncharacterized protein n=1 Tax=Portunus trituberculatus TaxID=210409 RepID=A0A5B7K423_PORTR|nr:hypothetical protein [Portunus trituberculatus]
MPRSPYATLHHLLQTTTTTTAPVRWRFVFSADRHTPDVPPFPQVLVEVPHQSYVVLAMTGAKTPSAAPSSRC